MLVKEFPFPIRTIQTDNGTEFTYKFISDTEKSPMDKLLETWDIDHVKHTKIRKNTLLFEKQQVT